MKKLYYDSAYIRTFEAKVLSCTEGKKGYEVILDQTAFYPEGGGQPYDTGILGGAHVTAVHDVKGEIVHYTDAPLTAGETVTGQIDWDRRFHNMQGHSGEHLVSGLIHAKYGYDNVGFHMGSEEITIDLNGTLTWDELLEIEKKANRMIWENLEIYAGFPSQEELAKMDYRSKKELTGDIRIVSIPNGDTCACCGTHVAKTGEIGLVKFLTMIHYKGGVRISLLCGEEAVMDYEKKREELQKISVFLSAKAGKTADAVEKLKNELMQTQAKLSETSRKLMKFQADQLKEGNDKICYLGDDLDMTELRHFVNFALEGKRGENCPRPVRKCEWGILLCSGEPERGHARSLEDIKWGTLRKRRGKQPDGTGNFLYGEREPDRQSGRERIRYGLMTALCFRQTRLSDRDIMRPERRVGICGGKRIIRIRSAALDHVLDQASGITVVVGRKV